MTENTLVSIAIPTYNIEKYIAETLQSCLDQTYPHIEITVTDDASKDRTVEIVRAFMEKHSNIKLMVQEKNVGAAKNTNDSIRLSTGEFFISLGHDDKLPPHHVERMLKWFTSPDIAFVHCNAMRIDGEGREIKIIGNDAEKIRQTQNPLKALCFNNFIQSCGSMTRRSAFEAIGGWDESFFYDDEWGSYVRFAEKFKFAYATDTIGYYRVHDTNITRTLQKKDKIFLLDDYRNRCRARAMKSANLSPLETALVHFKVWRKNIRRFFKHGLRPPPQKTPDDYRRVLIVKLGAFGDFINACDVFDAVRRHHPKAKITLLTTAPFTDLAEKSGYFDNVWTIRRWTWKDLSGWTGFYKEMRKRDFDCVYDMQRNDRARVFRWLSPARSRKAWVGGAKANRPYVHKKPLPSGLLDTANDGVFPIPDLAWMTADISRFGIRAPFVILVPGAAPQHPGKRWPVLHYAALARKLMENGHAVVAIGADAETEIIGELAALAPGVINLCCKTSFIDIASLARNAVAAVGNDTGAMHLISVVGCPVVTLFSGLTDPARAAPRGKRVAVLQGAPIETIDVEKAWQAFLKLVTNPE